MDIIQSIGKDRVREATPDRINREIDQKMKADIKGFSADNPTAIRNRLHELDKEWDIERALELNASVIAFTGVLLGATVNKKWLILPAVVTTFLGQHAIQGWCPPVPVFRRLGIRTQKEIQAERHALIGMLEK